MEPKEAIYSSVPTPKELELAQELLVLQQQHELAEENYQSYIKTLEQQTAAQQQQLTQLQRKIHQERSKTTTLIEEAIRQEQKVWQVKLDHATQALADEKQQKVAAESWLARFRQSEDTKTKHPMSKAELAISNFAQQVGLLTPETSTQILQYGILEFFSHVLTHCRNDLVLGPIAIALVHISLHENPIANPREKIVKTGNLRPIIECCGWNANKNVLAELVKVIASIAIFAPNRPIIASQNGVKALVRLLSSISDDRVQYAATSVEVMTSTLSALVNLAYRSDIIRTQIVSLNGSTHIIDILNQMDDIHVKIQAARLLANLSCNHFLNQGKIAGYAGDAAVIEQVKQIHQYSSDPVLQNQLIHACFTTISNLAHHDVNQAAIGYTEINQLLVQYIVQSTDVHVLRSATYAMASLQYQCRLNKNRFATHQGADALLYLLLNADRFHHDTQVLIGCCHAIASFVLTDANKRIVTELEGEYPVVQLGLTATDPPLLRAAAMAIAAIVPTDSQKRVLLAEGRPIVVEEEGAKTALLRAKSVAFPSDVNLPVWLTEALRIIDSNLTNLKEPQEIDWFGEHISSEAREDAKMSPELFNRQVLSMEILTEIRKDALLDQELRAKASSNSN